jgi:hypothetical protein
VISPPPLWLWFVLGASIITLLLERFVISHTTAMLGNGP